MHVEVFYFGNSLRNWSYLIWTEDKDLKKIAIVIDPYDAKPLINFLEKNNIKLLAILNTHQHLDHIRGNSELQKYTNCKIFMGEIPNLFPDYEIKNFFTPGHCATHYVYGFYQNKIPKAFFLGDLLFQGGVGRCMQDGDPYALAASLQKMISIIPMDCPWYPGHDYFKSSMKFAKNYDFFAKRVEALTMNEDGELLNNTLQFEKEHNIFLWTLDPSNWEKIPEDIRENHPTEFFVKLRRAKDLF